ncbi:MAG TPA: hypothetical protein VKP64_00055 [Mycobacteriales bacterium]|nr:hypothetical protein [Mycobacteriales bacterium]
MRTTRAVRLAATAAALAAAAVAVVTGWGAPSWWAVPALAVAVTVAELAVVHVTVARRRWAFSLTEGVIATALVLAPGGWLVAAVLLGMAVSQRLRGQDPLKVQYNAAQVAASAALAALLADALGGASGRAVGAVGGAVPAAATAMAGYWAVNQTLSALPVAILSGQPLRRLVTENVVLHAVHAAGSVSIGLLGAWLALTEPVALLGLLVPTALLWMSYDEQITLAAEARLFAELA